MIKIVSKRTIGAICKGLYWHEYHCKCSYPECNSTIITENIINAYEILRSDKIKGPLQVTSGYRCPRHNKDVGGSSLSYHQVGALDILLPEGWSLESFRIAAYESGFTYVRSYADMPRIHCDCRGSKC